MNVGFIGLGLMGGSMASNLQAAGHSLWCTIFVGRARRRISRRAPSGRTRPARSARRRMSSSPPCPAPRRSRRSPPEPMACSRACGAAARSSTSPPTRRRWCGGCTPVRRAGRRRARRAGQRRTATGAVAAPRDLGGRRPRANTTAIARCSRPWAISPTTWAPSARARWPSSSTTARASPFGRARGGVLHGRQGRRRARSLWQAVRQGAAAEPAPSTGSWTSSCQARSTRPRSRSSWGTRTSRSPPSWVAKWACRCAWPTWRWPR